MVSISGRSIGEGEPSYIIAEISANHGHSIDIARDTIKAAADAGASAVKLQTYTPDTITFPSEHEAFTVSGGTIWDGRTLYDLYAEAFMPWEWHEELFTAARDLGITLFSTPFDPTAVDLLASLGAPAYKIASFEIVDIPLIRYAARHGKPMLISTGIASQQEIQDAVGACREVGNEAVVLLRCTSAYPAHLEEMNLRTIPAMRERFGVPVGLSDHTLGHVASVAATALGACVIEKHIILDRSIGGPDAAFSMSADEFADMVTAVREVEACLGAVSYEIPERARASRRHARSLFVVEDVAAGEPVTDSNVRSIRPGSGLPPVAMDRLATAHFRTAVKAGSPLAWTMVDGVAATQPAKIADAASELTIEVKPGYRRLRNAPTSSELEKFCSSHYYQDQTGGYRSEYEDLEAAAIRSTIDRALFAAECAGANNIRRVLDVGCGEGHALAVFQERGWDAQGLDYSTFGLERHHPELMGRLMIGDVLEALREFKRTNRRFDLVWMDNFLEHVLDPAEILDATRDVLSDSGVVVIQVPNDYSEVQLNLATHGLIPSDAWVFIPDHVSYFSRSGLSVLAADNGLRELACIADFPIDWFLFNDASNYYRFPDRGKAAFQATLRLEELFTSLDQADVFNMYKALAELGLGRQIIMICSKGPTA